MAASKKRVEKTADAFRSIGEAAGELDLQTHVLRYWETKFPQYIRPVKRRDGRRLFRPQDMDALRAIQLLVHTRGMTLKGAKALLGEQGIESVLNGEARVIMTASAEDVTAAPSPARTLQATVRDAFDANDELPAKPNAASVQKLESVLLGIEDVKRRLDIARQYKVA